MKKMMLAAVLSAVGTVFAGGEFETAKLLDVERYRDAYVAKTNAAWKAWNDWNRVEREWNLAKRKDKKTPRPEGHGAKPAHPPSIKRGLAFPADDGTCALARNNDSKAFRASPVVLPVTLNRAGEHVFWIRHWRDENKRTALFFLLRNPDGECVKYELPDRYFDMWENTHDSNRVFDVAAPAGWIWTKVPVGIEYPGEYSLELGANTLYVQRGMNAPRSKFAIADAWVTDDPVLWRGVKNELGEGSGKVSEI